MEVPLFTDLLRDAGYEVALFGKAHVRGLGKRHWDRYFGFPSAATDYFWPVIEEGAGGGVESSKTYEGYVDDVVTEHSLEWMKQRGEKAFCALLWLQSPHAPFFRARRHLDLYNGISIPKPETFDDDLTGYPGKPRAFANADNKIGHLCAELSDAQQLRSFARGTHEGLLCGDRAGR
jgi:arylsulfatase A-like enzyme